MFHLRIDSCLPFQFELSTTSPKISTEWILFASVTSDHGHKVNNCLCYMATRCTLKSTTLIGYLSGPNVTIWTAKINAQT